MQQGDIVQIIDETHPWVPALLVVDEVKSWGVQAYVIVPQKNDGSEQCGQYFNRLTSDKIKKVGKVVIGIA